MPNIAITVLGSGCAKCKKLHELTQAAANELGMHTEVEYCTDVEKIIEMGVMSSPVLAINGKPVSVGSVPDLHTIKNLLSGHTEQKGGQKDCCSGKDCCESRCSPKNKSEGCCC